MEKQIEPLKGYLNRGKDTLEVEIAYASRYSLSVKFISDKTPIGHNTEFTNLILKGEDENIELSKCKFLIESTIDGFSGKIVFTEDLYDFHILFNQGRVQNLESLAQNLSLILSQKEIVKQEFKDYIAGLSYDLKAYQHHFDYIDSTLNDETEEIKDELFKVILKTEGNHFITYFDDKLKELEELIKPYNREEHKVHGFYLRKQLWDIILCSEFILRCNLKPRGYAGDSESMRMLYENAYRGDSTFSKLLYKYSMDHAASEAVRNRRIKVPEIIKEVKETAAKGIFKVMSVACGPAHELQDIFFTKKDLKSFDITLLDQDKQALGEANEIVQKIERTLGSKMRVTYLQESVRTMLKSHNISEMWGNFHFAYSMGLFDYLTPPVAKAVIEKIYDLLYPGGTLLIGNYHINNPSKVFMEYWHDWVLYYRTEEDFINLLRDTDAEEIQVEFEEAKSQMFLLARKPSK